MLAKPRPFKPTNQDSDLTLDSSSLDLASDTWAAASSIGNVGSGGSDNIVDFFSSGASGESSGPPNASFGSIPTMATYLISGYWAWSNYQVRNLVIGLATRLPSTSLH